MRKPTSIGTALTQVTNRKDSLIQINTSNSLIQNQSKKRDELLTWQYYLSKIAELEAVKRDNIPKETIELWYRDFQSRNWTKNKFDQQFEKVLKNHSYGAVKIDEFFIEENLYTDQEVAQKINSAFQNAISDAERILVDQEISVELNIPVNIQHVKFTIAKRIKSAYYTEHADLTDQVIDNAVDKVVKKLNLTPIHSGKRPTAGKRLKKRLYGNKPLPEEVPEK